MEPAQRKRNKIAKQIKPLYLSKRQCTPVSVNKQVIDLAELKLNLTLIEKHDTELNKQKEKTQASERKLRAFFNSSSSSHMLIDKEFNIIDFNKATAMFIKELHNKQVKQGRNALQYVSPSYHDEFVKCLNLAFEGQKSKKEILINYPDQEPKWWNISFEPIKDEDGSINSVAYSASNISERKFLQEEVIAQNESLLNIAHIHSHEYRKPVASILGLMELIKAENYRPSKKYLLLMEQAVKELDEKIRKAIGFAKIKMSKRKA